MDNVTGAEQVDSETKTKNPYVYMAILLAAPLLALFVLTVNNRATWWSFVISLFPIVSEITIGVNIASKNFQHAPMKTIITLLLCKFGSWLIWLVSILQFQMRYRNATITNMDIYEILHVVSLFFTDACLNLELACSEW
ncbi:hypothetical protein GEMRC1_012707 [Eukaryota sp. GEM-RC1]